LVIVFLPGDVIPKILQKRNIFTRQKNAKIKKSKHKILHNPAENSGANLIPNPETPDFLYLPYQKHPILINYITAMIRYKPVQI
jgi:hypothetical protein